MEWFDDLVPAILGGLYDFRVPVAIASVLAAGGLAVLALRREWLGRARRHPRASAAVLVPLLAVALPVAWYLASPLVLTASINEPPPVLPGASPPASVAPSGPAGASLTPRPSGPAATPSAPATSLLARSGAFQGSDDFHFGRGTARLIETAPGSFVVRLEDFAVRNGPDLYVYLSPDATGYAEGAIELGRLKADTGNQNYALPTGTLSDPSRAASVVIWCKQFSHLFATAPLAAG